MKLAQHRTNQKIAQKIQSVKAKPLLLRIILSMQTHQTIFRTYR